MAFSILELYKYSSRVRWRFANKLTEFPWDEVVRNREASFHSMRDILIHIIDNEDWIVNYVIQGKSTQYKRLKNPDDYHDMREVANHLNEVEARTKEYLSTVIEQDNGEKECKRRVDFVLRSSGKSFDLSVEECLFQSFTEQLYHLGELIALLWQQDTEPPQMQWFWNNPRQQVDNE